MGTKTTPKEYVKLTQEVLSSKTNIFETFPICIENIIKDKIWSEVEDKDGNPFKSFEAFCIHPLWQGLELTIDELLTYLKKASGVKGLVLGELESMPETGKSTGYKGGNQYTAKNDNIINSKQKKEQGTSPSYLSKRLKRDNPELFSKVQSGELSAHAAAIVAGIRKPMVQIRTDDVNKAVEKLLNHYNLAELQKAIMSYGEVGHAE